MEKDLKSMLNTSINKALFKALEEVVGELVGPEPDKPSAEEKLMRMLIATIMDWLSWGAVNQPDDFSATLVKLEHMLNQIQTLDELDPQDSLQ